MSEQMTVDGMYILIAGIAVFWAVTAAAIRVHAVKRSQNRPTRRGAR